MHIVLTDAAQLRTMQVLNIATHLQQAVMCQCAVFSTDGRQLAVIASNGEVVGYATETWKAAFQVHSPGAIDAQWLSKVGGLAFVLRSTRYDTGVSIDECNFVHCVSTYVVRSASQQLHSKSDSCCISRLGHV